MQHFIPKISRYGSYFILKLTAILVYYAVNLCLHKGGRANNHVVLKETALTFAGYLGCQLQISTIKLLEVIRIRNVARADTILTVLHDDVDGKSIKLLPNG